MTQPQTLLIARMKAGHRLMWCDSGPELSGFPFWPQKRTVRSLICQGILAWKSLNTTQSAAGIYEVTLAERTNGK